METLLELFAQNPYFSAGFGLIGVGTGLSVARNLVVRSSFFLQQYCIMKLEIPSKDPSYTWVLNWLTYNSKKTQQLSVKTVVSSERDSKKIGFAMIPSPGVHYLKWNGRWLKIERKREGQIMDVNSGVPFENVLLTTIGRDKSYFINLLIEAKENALKSNEGKTIIYTSWGSEWRQFGQPRRKRPLESVVLDDGISDMILNDVQDFRSNGKWYQDRGIPYRRGYLLYGDPGTGKSSFIQALAGSLDYNICIINLGEGVMTDDRFNHLLSNAPERSILLLEDIDAAFDENRKAKGQVTTHVSFSGLLNALDGVTASEERIIFMTTNHYNKLDPALIRPGRVDVKQYIGLASASQKAKMFNRFYPEDSDLCERFLSLVENETLSPAQIQGHFVMYKSSAKEAIDNIHELIVRDRLKSCS